MPYSLLSFFNNLSIFSCYSAVAWIVSGSVTLGIFCSTGNESINSRVSLWICEFSSSILLLASSHSFSTSSPGKHNPHLSVYVANPFIPTN